MGLIGNAYGICNVCGALLRSNLATEINSKRSLTRRQALVNTKAEMSIRQRLYSQEAEVVQLSVGKAVYGL